MNKTDFEKKFFSQVQYSPDCWEWLGSTARKGYGQFYFQGKTKPSHRWSYEYFIGPLGDLLCCHHCDNPPCVNPFHLFAGTAKDNAQDMVKKGRAPRQKFSHCVNGHAYTVENTYVRLGNNYCRPCQKEYKKNSTNKYTEYQREYRLKKRLKRLKDAVK